MPFRFIFFASGGNEGEKQKINSLDSGMRRNDGNLEGVWAARELWGGHMSDPTRALSNHGDVEEPYEPATRTPSSSGLTTHLPAFAVLREIAGFGIVRATRGNHSRCHAPSSGRAGMSCENRGGVLMESGDGARVKTAIPSALGGIDPRFSLAFDPPSPHSGRVRHSRIARV